MSPSILRFRCVELIFSWNADLMLNIPSFGKSAGMFAVCSSWQSWAVVPRHFVSLTALWAPLHFTSLKDMMASLHYLIVLEKACWCWGLVSCGHVCIHTAVLPLEVGETGHFSHLFIPFGFFSGWLVFTCSQSQLLLLSCYSRLRSVETWHSGDNKNTLWIQNQMKMVFLTLAPASKAMGTSCPSSTISCGLMFILYFWYCFNPEWRETSTKIDLQVVINIKRRFLAMTACALCDHMATTYLKKWKLQCQMWDLLQESDV